MLIAKVENNTILSIKHYKEMFPNISFDSAFGPDDGWLQRNGCMKVTVFKPHSANQKLVPTIPYIENDQVFTVAVEEKTSEEIAADNASKEAKLRAARDILLAKTDWMVIKALETNTALDTEWAQYRQALRDLPNQSGFPDIDMPISPDSPIENE